VLATLRICKYVIMITTGSISLTIAIPGKRLTGRYQCISSESTVDSKFQPHGVLATLCICKYVVMITTGSIGLTVTIPGKGLTGLHQCIGSEYTGDSKFQPHRILATLCICKYVIMITTGRISLTIAIPGEGLTSRYERISFESIVDSKFQPHCILATLCICKYVIMITACGISLTVTIPGEGLTSRYERISFESIVDSKFQPHRILASLCVCKYVIMITACGISLTITIPGEGFTGCHQRIGSESIVNRQFQSHGILASLCICKYVVMITGCSIGLTITIPGEGLTCCCKSVGFQSVIDRQLQCDCILTALCVGSDIIIIATGGIGLVVYRPGVRNTGSLRSKCVGTVIDRQLQCNRILTPLCISSDIIIITTGGVSLVVYRPCVRKTGSLRRKCVCTVIDRQLQCHCILTPLSIGSDVIIIATGGIGLVVHRPCVRNTGSLGSKCMGTVINRQLQCNRILTPLCISSDIIIITTGGIGLVVYRPCVRNTSSLRSKCVCTVIDRQLQCHCILTPLCIGSDVIIITTGGI